MASLHWTIAECQRPCCQMMGEAAPAGRAGLLLHEPVGEAGTAVHMAAGHLHEDRLEPSED